MAPSWQDHCEELGQAAVPASLSHFRKSQGPDPSTNPQPRTRTRGFWSLWMSSSSKMLPGIGLQFQPRACCSFLLT